MNFAEYIFKKSQSPTAPKVNNLFDVMAKRIWAKRQPQAGAIPTTPGSPLPAGGQTVTAADPVTPRPLPNFSMDVDPYPAMPVRKPMLPGLGGGQYPFMGRAL